MRGAEAPGSSSGESDEARLMAPILVTDPGGLDWQIAKAVEAQVFIDSHFVSSAEELEEQYQEYLPSSAFLLAYSPVQIPEGALRIISYNPTIGFKTINDIEAGLLELSEEGRHILDVVDSRSMLEVGTIGIETDARYGFEAHRISTRLYGGLAGICERRGTPYILASFDEERFRKFARVFGPSCKELGPAVDYMGSPTLPVLMDSRELTQHALRTLPSVGRVIANIAASMR